MDNISKHISYAEATSSLTAKRQGINNVPGKADLARMRKVADKLFEPMRRHMGVPIFVTSFYRSKAVNDAIGGSKTSQHLKGEAIDIDADVFGRTTNAAIFHYLRQHADYDQLIWEHGDDNQPAWVHVSYNTSGKQRGEVLQAYKDKNNKTRYKKWTS